MAPGGARTVLVPDGRGRDHVRRDRHEGRRASPWPWPGTWAVTRCGVSSWSRTVCPPVACPGMPVGTRSSRTIAVALMPPRRGLGQRRDRGRTHGGRGQGRAAGPRSPSAVAPSLSLPFARFAGWLALAPALASLAASTRPLGPWLDHGQRDTLPFLIHAHHPDRHHVSHTHDIVRALDVAIGELADMHEPRVLQTDVHEGSEVHHIENRALQLHAGSQVFKLENPLLEDRLGQVVTGVSLGTAEGLDDVLESELADAQILGQLDRIGFRKSVLRFGKLFLVTENLRCKARASRAGAWQSRSFRDGSRFGRAGGLPP